MNTYLALQLDRNMAVLRKYRPDLEFGYRDLAGMKVRFYAMRGADLPRQFELTKREVWDLKDEELLQMLKSKLADPFPQPQKTVKPQLCYR